MASIKDELFARYRSRFWGPMALAFVAVHWRVVAFLFFGRPSAETAISFMESHVSWTSVASAFGLAVVYVIASPWFELLLSRAASLGTRSRDSFQFREREWQLAERKRIAGEESVIAETRLKTQQDQTRLADIDLFKKLQNAISGSYFKRWLDDIGRGGINTGFGNAIASYFDIVDSPDGAFFNLPVEEAHQALVSKLSLVQSLIQDSRTLDDSSKRNEIAIAAQEASAAYKYYRERVRVELSV